MDGYLFLNNWREFEEWYRELGKLRIFWAKPVEVMELAEETKEYWVSRIRWNVRSRSKNACMLVFRGKPEAGMMREIHACSEGYGLIVLDEYYRDYLVEQLRTASAESILYVWGSSERVKEIKNVSVDVRCLVGWSEDEEQVFRNIHKESWGFYIPPREGEHMVVLALFNNTPAGMAYLNTRNANIDYGVHVKRRYWRKGIGSIILRKCIASAEEMGFKHATVVRVFRKIGGRTDDRRAVEFYKANNPKLRFRVLRV